MKSRRNGGYQATVNALLQGVPRKPSEATDFRCRRHSEDRSCGTHGSVDGNESELVRFRSSTTQSHITFLHSSPHLAITLSQTAILHLTTISGHLAAHVVSRGERSEALEPTKAVQALLYTHEPRTNKCREAHFSRYCKSTTS